MTKPRSNRLGMYADVREILDAALRHNGGEYECADYGAAVHWRQRAYQFRKLYAETLGLMKESPYDGLLLRRVLEGDNVVRIELRTQPGIFKPRNEEATAAALADDDELLNFAASLAAKIEGEE